MSIKLYIVLSLLSIPTMLGIIIITDYLLKISKTNKFRKWWSNNIVDLDNKYND